MDIPTIEAIRETREQIDPYIVETPVWHWRNKEISDVLNAKTKVILKLELFQHTGTFKPRLSLSNLLTLDREQLSRGVTGVSAGNHAIGLSYSAQIFGTSAKVVMHKDADPARIRMCHSYGAEVVLAANVHEAFIKGQQIEAEEGRYLVHPFEGRQTVLGDATVGLELCRQVDELDAVIVPIGGGGLCAGIATAVKQLRPSCQVFGVEPQGANTMSLSFASGKPESIDAVRTIADSLGAPYTMPYSLALCQHFVDEVVTISDDEMRRAMLRLFQGTKLAVEPAGAAATAALIGPLRERLQGKRVGLIVCGSNINVSAFAQHVAAINP